MVLIELGSSANFYRARWNVDEPFIGVRMWLAPIVQTAFQRLAVFGDPAKSGRGLIVRSIVTF